MTNPKTYCALLRLVLCGFLTMSAWAVYTPEEAGVDRKYRIKAAFLYNFLQVTDWPESKTGQDAESNEKKKDEPLRIGIIGEDRFGEAFKPIEGQSVKNRKLVITRFKGFSKLQRTKDKTLDLSDYDVKSLRACHLLFICSSEVNVIKDILSVIENNHILTISEVSDFLENGGMINFLPQASKGEFEVNLPALEKEQLQISSGVLRIAKRVIRKEK